MFILVLRQLKQIKENSNNYDTVITWKFLRNNFYKSSISP